MEEQKNKCKIYLCFDNFWSRIYNQKIYWQDRRNYIKIKDARDNQ